MSTEIQRLLDEAAERIDQARRLLAGGIFTPAPPPSRPAPAPAPSGDGFFLGPKSERELVGVHPALVKVVRRALELSTQDFTVHDGLRTLEEQRVLLAQGASQTLDSNHLKQADGFGHAVDLVPWIGGKPRWDWPAIYPIAAAMRAASSELGVVLTWGGVWDRSLQQLGTTPADMEDAVADYVARRRAAGKKSFIDGPHYELRAG